MDYVNVEEQKPQISEEIRLIPKWSVALAVAIFAAVQATVHLYLAKHDHNLPPRGFLIFWCVAWGTVLGVYTLMVGYVTRDAKRRGMNRALWTPPVIFMPGALLPAATAADFYLPAVLGRRCAGNELLPAVSLSTSSYLPTMPAHRAHH